MTVIGWKQNPFSLYDFLGYAVPGALLLYGLIALTALADPTVTAQEMVLKLLDFERAELYIPFILLSYVSGHITSFISSVTVEKYSIWHFGYPSKYLLAVRSPGYFEVQPPQLPRRMMRTFVWLILLPVSALDWFFGSLLRLRELYVRPLDRVLVDLLRAKVQRLLDERSGLDKDLQISAIDTDFFRFVYHYAVEHAPAHHPKMQNYVALYGFLRTSCLLAVLFFWAIALFSFLGTLTKGYAVLTMAAFAVVAYLLFIGFMKFYRRFSLEVLMAMSVVFPPGEHAG